MSVCLTFSELLKSFVPRFIFWCTIPDWVPVDCFSFLHDLLWTLDPDVLVTTQIWQTQRFGLLLGYVQVLLEQKWLGWSDRNRQKLEADTDRIFTTRTTLVRRVSQFSCNCCTEVLIVVACYLLPVLLFLNTPPPPPPHSLTPTPPHPRASSSTAGTMCTVGPLGKTYGLLAVSWKSKLDTVKVWRVAVPSSSAVIFHSPPSA